MEKFITSSPFKTDPMRVEVLDGQGHNTKTYDVPAGFQLERYVRSLFPNFEVHINFLAGNFCVEVVDQDGTCVEVHIGTFI